MIIMMFHKHFSSDRLIFFPIFSLNNVNLSFSSSACHQNPKGSRGGGPTNSPYTIILKRQQLFKNNQNIQENPQNPLFLD